MQMLRSLIILMGMLFAPYALAQNYPSKPVRIVSLTPGGAGDLVARLVAEGLRLSFGQPVVVDARAGSAAGPAMLVASAAPDGYTLLASGGNAFWLLPLVEKGVTYDPVKSYTPITITANSPNVLVVNPSVAASSVKELIALAQAQPGKINFGSGSAGASPYLAGELFKSMAHINIVGIRYKGTGPAVNATIANEVQILFPTVSSGLPHVKTGRLRALAVTSAKPTPLASGLPTVASSGLPGYESTSVYVIFGPAKIPALIVERLNRDIVAFLHNPDTREKLFNAGLDVVGSTPHELAEAEKSDMEKMGKVIRNAGIRAE
jgi:tripartite-type tricarboxylate transporter receptor subunit TctC